MDSVKLYHGDCVSVLDTLDLSNCVIVSDPPFNIN